MVGLKGQKFHLEQFGWGSFEVAEVLGEGYNRIVGAVTFRRERVAVKFADIWGIMAIRVGKPWCISGYRNCRNPPQLKAVGCTAGNLLVTKLRGSPIKIETYSETRV